MTQDAVARAIGVTRSTYVRYESGTRTPPLDVALRISNLMGLDVAVLFGPAVVSASDTTTGGARSA